MLADQENLKSFFSNFDFKEKKIEKKELYSQTVKDIAKAEMLELIYHNIPKIREIYRSVLGITFPDFSLIDKSVSTRHDLVHRNGKTKTGEAVIINKSIVKNVIDEVNDFVTEINRLLLEKASQHPFDGDQPF